MLRSANPGSWHVFDIFARQVDRRALASVTVRADIALAIGVAAGVDARAVYEAAGLSVDDALTHLDERIDVRHPGYDVVFSAPKGVSVAFGLAQSDVSKQVRVAHAIAVQLAMDYLELFVARGARGHEGGGQLAACVSSDGLAKDTLVDEQAQLVRDLTNSKAGVDIVVGPAGAGKTRALRVAREAWEAAGHTVIGSSLAAVAAQELQNGSGIRSTSMARFLASVEREGLPAGAVVVVDEASMIGTRQLLQVLQAAAQAEAKVVLVGDPCQLSEIDAGGLFGALARSEHALQLTANQRQTEEWAREA